MYRGHIHLWRKIFDNKYWSEVRERTKFEAMLDIILMACGKPTGKTVMFHSREFKIKRGQIVSSLRTLGSRWMWSHEKVRAFLVSLEKENFLTRKTVQQNLQITVSNYELYNPLHDSKSDNDLTMTRQQLDNDLTHTKKDKKDKALSKDYILPVQPALISTPGKPEPASNKSEIDKSIDSVLEYLNKKTGRAFRLKTKPYRDTIRARFNEGNTPDDCKEVIDKKAADPFFQQNPKHLNPVTLFRPGNFDRYLNEGPAKDDHLRGSYGVEKTKGRTVDDLLAEMEAEKNGVSEEGDSET